MQRRNGHPRLLYSAAALLVTCAAGAGWLSLSKSGAQTVPRPTVRPTIAAPRAKARRIPIGISDPQLVTESAKVQKAQLARMRSIGINSVRFDADWDWVEFAGPGKFYWSQLDREVHAVRAAGMSVDLVIDGCPTWAALPGARKDANPQPASAAAFATWAADVVRRYAKDGVKYFEIWNEPNDSKFWQPKVNPAFYTKMLADSYRAIKKVDPSAVVISGGLAPIPSSATSLSMLAFLQAIYADGAKHYMNAVALHPYSYPALPSEYEPWSAWSQMSQTSPSARSIMAQYKDAGIPIWVTEFGAVSNGPSGGAGPQGEAEELSQAIAIARSTRWIGAFYIYTWQDAGANKNNRNDWFGLVTNTGRAKPAYYAVEKAIAKKD
jgi:polysaccharide biosynthesis protein PslG